MKARNEKLLGKSKGKVHSLDSYKQAKCSQDTMNKSGTFISKCIFSQLMFLSGASTTCLDE